MIVSEKASYRTFFYFCAVSQSTTNLYKSTLTKPFLPNLIFMLFYLDYYIKLNLNLIYISCFKMYVML